MAVIAPERVVAGGGAPRKRSWHLVVALLIGAVLGGAVAYLAVPDGEPFPTWQRVARYSELQRESVMFLEDENVFLVSVDSEQPLALSGVSPHSPAAPEQILYCETSGYFEAVDHGEKFDGRGRYAIGPAPRGMDGFAVLVVGDDVYIDRTQTIRGAPRFEPRPEPRIGSFCAEGADPERPGFAGTRG